MNNESIHWDNDMFECLEEKIDWSAPWKIKNIKLDISFFKKYEHKIECSFNYLSKNIEWSDDLLSEYGDKFDWSKRLIMQKPLSTLKNLRKYKDIIDWSLVSQSINIEFTEDILKEFSDKWDWKKLSANKNLPISVEFIQKFIELLDFDSLSQNPKCLELINKYPESNKWNWNYVILNPAITYNQESFAFIFGHYKMKHENKFTNPLIKKMALSYFLIRVLSLQRNDIRYFLQDDFTEYLPWDGFCRFCKTRVTLEFIEKHKDKLNFRESEFFRINRDIISRSFLEANMELFDPTHYSFYYLPLTIELLNKLDDKINFYYLSRNEKLDWTWEYIDDNFEKFNFSDLNQNKGIYEKLIKKNSTDIEILEFLNLEMKKKRNNNMIECYICCHKDEHEILKVKVPWWNNKKLMNEYDFYQVEFGGEIDDHLTVSGEELKAIHEANLPPEKPDNGNLPFTPWYNKKDPFIEGQINAIIQSADAYDKIEIVLFYWSSGY